MKIAKHIAQYPPINIVSIDKIMSEPISEYPYNKRGIIYRTVNLKFGPKLAVVFHAGSSRSNNPWNVIYGGYFSLLTY